MFVVVVVLLFKKYLFSPAVIVVKNPLANAGDARGVGLIPGVRRFPGRGHGNPLQYSCRNNPMDQGAYVG